MSPSASTFRKTTTVCVCTCVQVRWGAAGALPSIFSLRKRCDVSRGNDMIRVKQGCLSMGHAAQEVSPPMRQTDNWLQTADLTNTTWKTSFYTHLRPEIWD